MRIRIAYIVFGIIGILLSSCSKAVYEYSDDLGYSKFILFDNGNYKYKEKSPSGKFSRWGTYEYHDSMLVFVYPEKLRLPYNYQKGAVEKLPGRKSEEYLTWTFREKISKRPVMFASVEFYNKHDHVISGVETDTNGVAKINLDSEIFRVKIRSMEHADLELLWDEYSTNDLLIELERYEMGGRLIGACLPKYRDLILRYKVTKDSLRSSIQRGDLIYQKQ